MSGEEETRASGEETATVNANDLTTQTVGSVTKDLLHFAGRAASDTHNKFTRNKLTEIFTPSTGSSANLRPVPVIHLEVAPPPGGLDLMSDFIEDASDIVGKDKQ